MSSPTSTERWESSCQTPEEAIRAGTECVKTNEPEIAWVHFRRALDLARTGETT